MPDLDAAARSLVMTQPALLVPEPSVCATCHGDRVVPDGVADRLGLGPMTYPCPACCCEVCGKPTDTPPECFRCARIAEETLR